MDKPAKGRANATQYAFDSSSVSLRDLAWAEPNAE